MTLQTCKRLLAHYTEIGNEKGIAEMTARIALKEKLPKYLNSTQEEPVQEAPVEEA